eukprot:757924-Prymnesium_polylepis.1
MQMHCSSRQQRQLTTMLIESVGGELLTVRLAKALDTQRKASDPVEITSTSYTSAHLCALLSPSVRGARRHGTSGVAVAY